ncbi:MAG: amino acid ABC transporter permease [Actinobacteria bacterium]|nr:amino acid ABC transporter permease [Actinomycetota bacterium]
MSVLAAFDWSFIWEQRSELAHGLVKTLEVSAIGIAGAFAIGVALGAARAHRIPVVSQLAAVYVEVIRNTPILVQIFLLFYGLPQLTPYLRFEPFTTAWLAVMIWGGAFNTENYRAGFGAVPYRYREASLALGFTPLRTFFSVTLPIGSRIALPSSINTYISVLKNTALMTAIGFPELTNVARSIAAVTFRDAEMIVVIAIVYLAVVWSLSIVIRFVERRLALPEEA